jgi:MOSC domain-containing protein YiiM
MMSASILQINVSSGGLPKYAVAEASVHRLGIEGDIHAHPKIHGGPLRALLLMDAATLDEIAALGYSITAGSLGENITTLGMDRRRVRIGQQYRVGNLIIEITKPRGPCTQLDCYGAGMQEAIYDPQVKARDHSSPRWGMSGFYASVVQGGQIRPGDPIALLSEMA